MDDGPQPRRDLKPVAKKPNCVDQFNEQHKMRYEEREKQSEGRVKSVEEHNSAYPKMRDEVDRRRSISKVKGTNSNSCSRANQQIFFNPKCSDCRKLKRQMEIHKNSLSRSSKRTRYGGTRAKAGIQKREIKSNSQRHTNVTRKNSKACQYAKVLREKKIGTCLEVAKSSKSIQNSNKTQIMVTDNAIDTQNFGDYTQCYQQLPGKFKMVATERKSSQTSERKEDFNAPKMPPDPDSETPSVSSYHTSVSLDDEPMVS